ncbi:hypothetical protein EJM73_06670 [Clostridium botulinum]|uniref:hypothetical protein n=1 Tax=Clostridium TaxID=1485 RepID=UPI0004AD94C2|nr:MULTISPECIES: hypothetical protein [Clostridium]APH24482.1 hypothetical protein NPD1_750 [Clostridium botulinum]APQ78767.1 hypothetical protein RSJ10_3808 [Clostridium botulinum]MBE1304140.1 hypothetical protein [Clostridium botulinum]MBY7004532.1 hypothetical protein [Clostridium botulinum]MCR1147197.1 hypothetical protein [Clostridium botulinum]
MKITLDAIYVGEIGDSPIKITLDDLNHLADNLNLWIDDRHYVVKLKELKKAIECIEK